MCEQEPIALVLHTCDAKIAVPGGEVVLLDGLFRVTLNALMTGRLRITAFVEPTDTATMPVLHYRSHTRRRDGIPCQG